MTIALPKQTVRHRRKQPRTPIINRSPFFGVFGKVLTYREAMAVYHKIQDFLDLWDVEAEIDYRESEEWLTKEEASQLSREARDIADEYRSVLDDDGHWNEVLMDILAKRRRKYDHEL